MGLSQMLNSFVETQEAMMMVLLKALQFIMSVFGCCVVVCGWRECGVVVKADVLYEQRLFGCREACGHRVSGGAPRSAIVQPERPWCTVVPRRQ